MKQLLFGLVCFLFTVVSFAQDADDYNRSLFVGALVVKGVSNPVKGVTAGIAIEDYHAFLGVEAEWMKVPPQTEENPFVYYYPFRAGAFALFSAGPVVSGLGVLFPGEVYLESGFQHRFFRVLSGQLLWRASLANSPELNGVSLRVNFHFYRYRRY